MAARHRRPVEGNAGRRRRLGTPQGSGDTAVGVAVEDRRRLQRPRRRTRRVKNGTTDSAAPAEQGIAGYNWVWKRGWHLDKKNAEKLAYYMKTRYISIALASLGLRLANLISSPVMVFILAAAAGSLGWAAEYIKHRSGVAGDNGISITLGIRWARWVVTPWLDATPRK